MSKAKSNQETRIGMCMKTPGMKTSKIPSELKMLAYWELEKRRCREFQFFLRKKALEIFGFFNYVQVKLYF